MFDTRYYKYIGWKSLNMKSMITLFQENTIKYTLSTICSKYLNLRNEQILKPFILFSYIPI